MLHKRYDDIVSDKFTGLHTFAACSIHVRDASYTQK